MTTELPSSNPSLDPSHESIPDLLARPAEIGGIVTPKGNPLAAQTADEKKRAEIKLLRGYKYGRDALKMKAARLRGKPLRIERDRSSGYRRKQP